MKCKVEKFIYLSCPEWADDEGIMHTKLKDFHGQVPVVGDFIELNEDDQSESMFVVSSRIFSFDDCVPPVYIGLTLNLIKIDSKFSQK